MSSRHGGLTHSVPRFFRGLLAVIILASTLSSCINTDPIQKAVEVIDNGIRAIEQNSAVWASVLQRVADQLPREIDEAIRVDAQALATRSIAMAGVEFRCEVDFFANRAIQLLQHLKAELLKQNPPKLPPAFCQVEPAAIDLKISPTKWPTAMLTGYDLDYKDNQSKAVQFLLLNAQGRTTPLAESRIGRTTHYQITLNLGDMARQLYHDQIVKIVAAWGGESEGFPQIVIVPWEPRRQKLPPLSMGSTGPYYPLRVGSGDADFDTDDDDPTNVEVAGEIQVTAAVINSRVFMHAREVKPDHTEVRGWTEWSRAYTAPAGWRIVEVLPRMASVHQAVISMQGRVPFDRPAGEVVSFFEVWLDRDGDEAGTWSRVVAHWRPLEITIEELAPEWLR